MRCIQILRSQGFPTPFVSFAQQKTPPLPLNPKTTKTQKINVMMPCFALPSKHPVIVPFFPLPTSSSLQFPHPIKSMYIYKQSDAHGGKKEIRDRPVSRRTRNRNRPLVYFYWMTASWTGGTGFPRTHPPSDPSSRAGCFAPIGPP